MKSIKKITLLLAFVITTNLCFAPPQPPTPGTSTGNGQSVDAKDTPIATGTLLLLGLGGAFAGYKVVKRRKERV
jgi:hypothetical protein